MARRLFAFMSYNRPIFTSKAVAEVDVSEEGTMYLHERDRVKRLKVHRGGKFYGNYIR